jgi:hypothetical protein
LDEDLGELQSAARWRITVAWRNTWIPRSLGAGRIFNQDQTWNNHGKIDGGHGFAEIERPNHKRIETYRSGSAG